jgi:hypothetical protein
MELTKEQTLVLLINKKKQESIKQKYSFNTKFKWFCLHCLKTIYLSYKQYGRNAIFCEDCYPKFANKETIVQYQYVRVLKEKQLELIEKQLK